MSKSFRRNYSKYPSLGILDALYELSFGVNTRGVPRERVYNCIREKKKITRQIFSKAVYRLKMGGFIEYANDQNFVLKNKGKEMIDFVKIDRIRLNEKRTDNLWRLIIFDIPEIKRGARDILRAKLNEFECYLLQKSVYVTPYSCEQEISEIMSCLGLTDEVKVLLVKSLGSSERKIKTFFNLV